MILIYITNSSAESAKNIARHLLGKKLIACANIYSPIQSMYLDNGIAEETEAVLIAKTKDSYFEKVKKEVEHIHPYTIPCILKIHVKANKKYEDWMEKELK